MHVLYTHKLDFFYFIPELWFLGFILSMIIFLSYFAVNKKANFPLLMNTFCSLTMLGLLSLLVLIFLLFPCQVLLFDNYFIINQYTQLAKAVITFSVILTIAFLKEYWARFQLCWAEYVIFLLLATFGMFLAISSFNLMTLFVALEIVALSNYILTGFNRRSSYATEASIKFYISGLLATLIMLGSLVGLFNTLGTTSFSFFKEMTLTLNSSDLFNKSSIAACAFLFCFCYSLFIKLGLAPFHFWAPDIYDGLTSCTSYFFATTTKATYSYCLINLLISMGLMQYTYVFQICCFIICLSLIVGALGGFYQTHLKRLLAYSSIMHSALVLLIFVANSNMSFGVLTAYLFFYITTSFILWAFVALMEVPRHPYSPMTLNTIAALVRSNPMLTFIFFIAICSMAGLPPFAGFFTKLMIFFIAIQQGYIGFAIFVLIISLLGTYYYLRLVKAMMFIEVRRWLSFMALSKRLSFWFASLTMLNFYIFIDPDVMFRVFFFF